MTLDPTEFVTASDAARILGVSRAMVTWYIQNRDLYATRFGPRTVLLKRSAVEALKQRRASR